VLVDFGVISRAELAAGRLAHAARVIIDEAHDLAADVLEQVSALVDADGDGRLLQICS
jgi:hypothetical protein